MLIFIDITTICIQNGIMIVSYPFYKFKVKENTPLGRACVATSIITKGEIICKMRGTPISFKQFCERHGAECDDLLQIDNEQYIDLMEPFVCFNHSCDPNAGIRNKNILFALRNIEQEEEIMFDYSTTADDPLWTMECRCRTKLCRKIIGDFQSLPHERKEYYRTKGALPDHILETYY